MARRQRPAADATAAPRSAMDDAAHDDKIDDAAREIDWIHDVYVKLPRRGICSRGGASDVLKTINKMTCLVQNPGIHKRGIPTALMERGETLHLNPATAGNQALKGLLGPSDFEFDLMNVS